MTIKKIFFLTTILMVVSLIGGCRQQNTFNTSQPNGIFISLASTSIGAEEKNGVINKDVQVLSYNFAVTNNTNSKVYINSIKPIFEPNFAKNVVSKDTEITIQKELLPNSSITIEGSKIKFDAKGMTKEQIAELSPYITDIRVNFEETLGFAKKITLKSNAINPIAFSHKVYFNYESN
jgi:hypothetical protein